MARETISYNEIPDLNEDWSHDKRNGLPYSGSSVQNFLRSQLSNAISSLRGKYGSVVYEGGRINFYDEAGGTVLDTITITGTSYIVNVGSNQQPTFTVLTSDTSSIITITPSTESIEFGSSTKEEYPEDYSFKVEVDSGSGFIDRTPSVNTIKSGQSASIEVRNHLTTGVNRVRIVVTGAESGQPKTLVFTITLTSLSLSCSHAWEQTWFGGSTYQIGGILFSGNIAKTLHVKVDETEYTQDYAANTQYVNVPTTFDLTNYAPAESGVKMVEIWMTGEGVETQHIIYQIMYVAQKDISNPPQLICFNNAPSKVYNFSQEDLVKYAVYNVPSLTTRVTARYGSNEVVILENTEDTIPNTIYTLSLNIQVDTDLTDGISLLVEAFNDAISKSVEIAVDNSKAFLPTPDAKFYLNTSLGNNATTDRTYIMNNAPVSEGFQATYNATWDNFTFSKDAWDSDDEGNRALVVKAGSTLRIPDLKPLRTTTDVSTTFEFMFRADNVADYDTPILTCIDTETYDKNKSVGFILFPTRILILSKDTRNEVFQQLPLGEGRIHHLCLVFQKQYGGKSLSMCRVFLNGVENLNFSYQDIDTFYPTTAKDYGGLVIGQQSTDVYLYMMRIYKKALEGRNAIDNFLNVVIENAEVNRLGIKDNNNVIDGTSVDYNLVKKAGFNTFVVETDNPLPSLKNPVSYSAGVNIHLEYNDHPEWNVSIYDAPLDRQGTTSSLYMWANLRSKIKKPLRWVYPNLRDAEGNVKEETSKNGYLFGYEARPRVQKITWKKNVASQPQGHKMGATALYNDWFKEVFGAEALVKDGILPSKDTRVATEQMPFVGFQKKSDGTYTFIGMYTGGPDKTDKKTFSYDATEAFPKLMMIEGPNHDPYLTRFLVPWTEDVFYDYVNETLSVGASSPSDGSKQEGWDADIAAGYGTDKAGDAQNIMNLFVSEFKPAYDSIYYCSPYLVSLTDALAASGYASLDEINNNIAVYQRKETNGFANSLLTLYDEQYRLIYYRVKTGKYEVLPLSTHNMLDYLGLSGTPSTAELIEARRQKWISTLGVAGVVNLPEAYFHDVFCEMIGATDNDAKNTYWRKFKELAQGGKWGFNQDDLDTIFQNDNNGQDTKEYYVEPNDTNNGNDIFQGRTSAFWYALRLWCKDNIRAMAVEMVNAASDMADRLNIQANTINGRLLGLIEYYMWKKSSKYFPKTIYNEDTQLAYIDVWYEDPNKVYNNVPPLTQIHGDHYETERAWVEKRISYMFSKFQIGAFQGSSPDGYGTLEFTPLTGFNMQVTPAIWLYPRISIGGSETEQSVRTEAGKQCTLALPSSGTTGVYIKGLDWLSDLGDLSGLQLASRGGSDVISFSVLGKRLRRLKVGDAAGNVSFNATILSVAGKCIEEIDAQNASTISGSLDLRECPRLRTLLLAGTSLANIYPPVGGRLLRLQYPDTLSTLFMHSLNLLTEDNIEISDAAKANISTIYINSCDNINAFAFLRSVYNTQGNRLANIGVIWKGVIEDDDATTMVMLGDIAKNAGVDGGYRGVTYNDNGEIISQSVPNISGTIHVNYPVYVADVEAVAQAHIPLTINYDADNVYIPFADDAVKKICATKWGDGVGLTYPKAAAVTSLGNNFSKNTAITSFDELGEFGVTSLADGQYGVFVSCSNLVSVDLSKITIIGANAFQSCPLFAGDGNGDLRIPNLTSIGNNSFGGYNKGTCTGLKRVMDLGSITTIPDASEENMGTFRNQLNLTDVTLPETLTKIGNRAFQGCISIANINFPSAISTIADLAFYNCESLAIDDLSLPNLTSLGLNAFYGVKIKKISNLGSITTLPGTNTTNGTLGDKTALEEVMLPETLKSIGPNSITGYTNLTSIGSGVFPNLTTIGYNCFYNIPNVAQAVSFPALTSVTSDSGSGQHLIFTKCGFTEFHAPLLDLAKTNVYKDTYGILSNCTNLRVIEIGGLTVVPFGFAQGCTSLESVSDLSKVTSVSYEAFKNTPSLRIHLSLPVCTKILADTANSRTGVFYNSGILSLDAPMLMEIGKDIFSYGSAGAFQGCANLTLVKLRDVTTIGINAFYKCPNLSKVVINNSTPPTRSSNAFASCSSDLAFYVPDSAVEAYKSATNWTSFADRIKPLSEYVES